MMREARQALFDKCVKSMTQSSTMGWFKSETGSWKVRRGNAVRWLLWCIFSTHEGEMLQEWEDELDYYMAALSIFLGYPLEHGINSDMTCMRPTMDPVVSVHRPLIWYMVRSPPPNTFG